MRPFPKKRKTRRGSTETRCRPLCAVTDLAIEMTNKSFVAVAPDCGYKPSVRGSSRERRSGDSYGDDGRLRSPMSSWPPRPGTVPLPRRHLTGRSSSSLDHCHAHATVSVPRDHVPREFAPLPTNCFPGCTAQAQVVASERVLPCHADHSRSFCSWSHCAADQRPLRRKLPRQPQTPNKESRPSTSRRPARSTTGQPAAISPGVTLPPR